MAKLLIAIPIGLAITLAALSGAHWWITLEGQPDAVRYGAAFGSVCLSLAAFQLAYMAGKGYGVACILACAIFFAGDSYQNSLGYQTVTGLTVSGDVEAAQTRLDAARADLAALPLPDATGAIRKASTWETVNAALEARVAQAEADLQAVSTPTLNEWYVLAAMSLIQFALSLTFMALGRGTKAVRVEEAAPVVADNVVRLKPVQPKRMDAKDMRVWTTKLERVR